MLSFEISKKDAKHLENVLDALGLEGETRLQNKMSVKAAHASGCPLDFQKLAQGKEEEQAHDVYGIHHHVDRDTGRLMHEFRPRCALPDQGREIAA